MQREQDKGSDVDSWSTTLRLVLVMVAVALSYLVGRWVAETLQGLAAGGGFPTF